MSVLYVMSELGGIGKTMVCASLANNLKRDGYDVVVSKVHGDSAGDIQTYEEKFSLDVREPKSESADDLKGFINSFQIGTST